MQAFYIVQVIKKQPLFQQYYKQNVENNVLTPAKNYCSNKILKERSFLYVGKADTYNYEFRIPHLLKRNVEKVSFKKDCDWVKYLKIGKSNKNFRKSLDRGEFLGYNLIV